MSLKYWSGKAPPPKSTSEGLPPTASKATSDMALRGVGMSMGHGVVQGDDEDGEVSGGGRLVQEQTQTN